MTHSTLAPSSAARRAQCPGSRALESSCPPRESEAADEGTRAHAVVHALWNRDNPPANYDDEMLKHARDFIAYVEQYVTDTSVTYVEHKVEMPLIHEQSFGTPDFVVINDRETHIIDYKYGRVSIDAKDNLQLISYAAAYYRYDHTYHLHIYQPRDFTSREPARVATYTADELAIHIARLQVTEAASMRDDAPLRTGDQCTYCAARYKCPALALATAKAYETATASDAYDRTLEESAQELMLLQQAQGVINMRIKALSAYVEQALRNGEQVPQFRLAEKRGRETWSISAHEAAALADLHGVDIRKPIEVITPKQAISAGLPAEFVRKYTQVASKLELESC